MKILLCAVLIFSQTLSLPVELLGLPVALVGASPISSPPRGVTPVAIGFAQGFPPYQELDSQGKPQGLDVELTKAVFAQTGIPYYLSAGKWDNQLARLRFNLGVDVLMGAEITSDRLQTFRFSEPLYTRQSALLVPANNHSIHSLSDLSGLIVTGDRGSRAEELLKRLGILERVRLRETSTKAQAFQLLKEKKVDACIMPEAVGVTLARQEHFSVRLIPLSETGTPVGFAFRPSETSLIYKVNEAINTLRRQGQLAKILNRWLKKSG